jgi:hypothetical protein
MTKPIGTRFALGSIDDLTNPTTTQKYPLGMEVTIHDTDKHSVKTYVYVYAVGTLTQYVPYVLTFAGVAGTEVEAIAPLTTAAPGQRVCVPQVGITATYYGFVQVGGDCSCFLTAETYAVGDYLQILTTGTALVVDGTSGATIKLPTSCAISKSAAGTATAESIVLLNIWAETAAT